MHVHLSSHFRSCTAGKATVEAAGATVGEVMNDLDRRYPGLRFRLIDEQDRVRRHVKVFVNLAPTESLSAPVLDSDELHLIGALSGG